MNGLQVSTLGCRFKYVQQCPSTSWSTLSPSPHIYRPKELDIIYPSPFHINFVPLAPEPATNAAPKFYVCHTPYGFQRKLACSAWSSGFQNRLCTLSTLTRLLRHNNRFLNRHLPPLKKSLYTMRARSNHLTYAEENTRAYFSFSFSTTTVTFKALSYLIDSILWLYPCVVSIMNCIFILWIWKRTKF